MARDNQIPGYAGMAISEKRLLRIKKPEGDDDEDGDDKAFFDE